MNSYGDLHDINNLITQIIARDVAAGVEMARSLGHKMPTEFDVGVKFIGNRDYTREGEKVRVRIRLDDAFYDSIVLMPFLTGVVSLPRIEQLWKAAFERIHGDAWNLAQVWLDKHPEAFVSKAGAVKAVAILDALKADDDLFERWMDSCAKRAGKLKYETR